MPNGAHSQARGEFVEHEAVFQIRRLSGLDLRDVQAQAEDRLVWLAQADTAGDHEEVDELVEPEAVYAILANFLALVADHADLEPVARLQLLHQFDRLGER